MKDKVVLVTGGNSGIGRAAALAFARKGAKMVIAARGAERGHRVAREIEAGGARALFVRADVSQAADVHGLVKTTVDCWGRLDCACNNAASVEEPFVPTAAFTEAQFDRVAQSEELLVVPATGDPPDTGAGAARRSNCQYLFGQRPVRCAAMGFVRGGQSGIDRVDQVRGARVRPPGCAHPSGGRLRDPDARGRHEPRQRGPARRAGSKVARRYSEMIAAGRIGCPQEAAEAALWLCSDAASYVTGHSMIVDGGLTAAVR